MDNRLDWFRDARLGIFLTWGLYSVLGRNEWSLYLDRLRLSEYEPLADRFDPTRFDAARWAAMAVDSGAKYMVLTTRHCDGFCLFDSSISDFSSVRRPPGAATCTGHWHDESTGHGQVGLAEDGLFSATRVAKEEWGL